MEDRKHCLEECFLDKRTCRLFNHSSYSTLGSKQPFIAPLISKLDIDHYENILKLKNRCGARHIAFMLIKDAELPSFKILKGQNLSLPDCLIKCLESLICTFVQYFQGSCIFGMEKLIEDQEPLLLDNSFLFEPICLPDPPNNLTILDCEEEHVFEKVVNMELRGDNIEELGVIRDIPNIKLDECLDACILDEFCLSINYYSKIENNSSTICQILPFNRNNNNKTLSVLIQGVNYYELACKRERIGGNKFEQNIEKIEENKEILKTTTTTTTNTTIITIINNNITKLQKCSFLPNSGIQECNNNNVATTTQTIFPTLITKEFNFSKLTIKPTISDIEETTEKIIKTTSSKNSEIKNSKNNNRLYLNQLNVYVFCDSQGANVSFQLKNNSQRYSGKIYAADRFDNCLLNVKNAKEFFFFVNKPGNNLIKNWCNAKINNDQLNILLVLSNSVGEGIPPEVTTKDDLFFYITCRYINGLPIPEGNVTNGFESYSKIEPEKENNKKYLDEQTNFVENRGDTRIKLKILKNGKPINNVFIGEKLLSVVESNSAINPENFRVSECNATRVLPPITDDNISEQIQEYSGPSIPLLDSNGCSLHPQIMGNMRRVGDHLEATLTAFRIDGGSELEIICSVIICRSQCKTAKCSRKDTLEESNFLIENEANFNSKEFLNIGETLRHRLERRDTEEHLNEADKITVDKRIRVLVMKEENSPISIKEEENEDEGEKVEMKEELKENRLDEESLKNENSDDSRIISDNEYVSSTLQAFEITNDNENDEEQNDGILEPFIILFSIALLLILSGALFATTLINWLHKRRDRSNKYTNSERNYFYPSSNEIGSQYFYIPRIQKDFVLT
ncbi:unnamed protein product [Meloidogyne enterolobii]|uniref:Uncharacterized protein n=3 Tax=Meloidogyne enterolobii TaxID=390850 RepID=A0ACB1B367_MELEN|nr:unnamed protein product [Meloidogyne enterolobii]